MRTGILLAALVLAGGFLASRAKTRAVNAEQEIKALEDKVNAAYAANDLPAYFSFYAADLSAQPWLTPPGQRFLRVPDMRPAYPDGRGWK